MALESDKQLMLPVNFSFDVYTIYLIPGGDITCLVRVCAAHIGGFFGPKFPKQRSLCRQIFRNHGWVFQKFAKNCQLWVAFPPKFIIKMGMTATVGN